MFEIISQILSYPFLVNAFIVGILVSLCAALLGVNLVLKNYAMIGDGLSHVGFGALALATALNMAPLKLALPVVIVSAFFLLQLNENSKLKGDSAIALFSTSALAIGVLVSSMSKGMNTDVYSYMFGSILAMDQTDVLISIAMSVMVISLFLFFYQELFIVTFDENFARAIGVKVGFYNSLLAFLTAITIVLGMRIMGALLISSLIIFPALTSMQVFKNFRLVIISSSLISLFSFVNGILASYLYSTPTGASVVIINLLIFLLFSLIKKIQARF